MSARRDREAALLTAPERADVDQTRYPEILSLSRHDLMALVKRLRDHRDRAQAIGRQQRREIRGKAAPRGATPARDNVGTVEKAQVLAQAVKRGNAELARLDAPPPEAHHPTQAEIARKALEMRQAMRLARHPSGGWTAGTGMHAKPSDRPTVQMDPREIGRVSQAIKVAQAKRDG
jgi:hypothetical protein